MKYRDYLILPVMAMYLVYASCTYIGEPEAEAASAGKISGNVNPSSICWGTEEDAYGETWYAPDGEAGECFSVLQDADGGQKICFVSNTTRQKTETGYTVTDGHLRCRSSSQSYDLVFTDALTAVDTISGKEYCRADAEILREELCSRRFVNNADTKDVLSFSSNGKATENAGERVFHGKWSLRTTDTLTLSGFSGRMEGTAELIFDAAGEICGLRCGTVSYSCGDDV